VSSIPRHMLVECHRIDGRRRFDTANVEELRSDELIDDEYEFFVRFDRAIRGAGTGLTWVDDSRE